MESSLENLLAEGVIDEVLGRLKSGKEADVHRVRHRAGIIVAKIYKERAPHPQPRAHPAPPRRGLPPPTLPHCGTRSS